MSYAETSKALTMAGMKQWFLLSSGPVPESTMIVWKETDGIQGMLRGKGWAGGILRQFFYSETQEAIALGVAFVSLKLTGWWCPLMLRRKVTRKPEHLTGRGLSVQCGRVLLRWALSSLCGTHFLWCPFLPGHLPPGKDILS